MSVARYGGQTRRGAHPIVGRRWRRCWNNLQRRSANVLAIATRRHAKGHQEVAHGVLRRHCEACLEAAFGFGQKLHADSNELVGMDGKRFVVARAVTTVEAAVDDVVQGLRLRWGKRVVDHAVVKDLLKIKLVAPVDGHGCRPRNALRNLGSAIVGFLEVLVVLQHAALHIEFFPTFRKLTWTVGRYRHVPERRVGNVEEVESKHGQVVLDGATIVGRHAPGFRVGAHLAHLLRAGQDWRKARWRRTGWRRGWRRRGGRRRGRRRRRRRR